VQDTDQSLRCISSYRPDVWLSLFFPIHLLLISLCLAKLASEKQRANWNTTEEWENNAKAADNWACCVVVDTWKTWHTWNGVYCGIRSNSKYQRHPMTLHQCIFKLTLTEQPDTRGPLILWVTYLPAPIHSWMGRSTRCTDVPCSSSLSFTSLKWDVLCIYSLCKLLFIIIYN
jgi:hypothetical protein